MKKFSFRQLVLLCFAPFLIKGQNSYTRTGSNYLGSVAGVYHPGNLVDNRIEKDLTILSGGLYVTNNYFGSRGNLFRSFLDKEYREDNGTAFGEVPANGQFSYEGSVFSLMYSQENKGFGLSLNARSIYSLSNLDTKLAYNLFSAFAKGHVYPPQQSTTPTQFSHLSWQELQLSYGQTLLNKEKWFIKGGASLKFLRGEQFLFTEAVLSPSSNTLNSVNFQPTQGEMYYSNTMSTESGNHPLGVGIDAGITLEWRPNISEKYYTMDDVTALRPDIAKHRLRLNLLLKDLGQLRFTPGANSGSFQLADTSIRVVHPNFQSFKNTPEDVSSYMTVTPDQTPLKVALPYAFVAEVDYRFNDHWGVFIHTQLHPGHRYFDNYSSQQTLSPYYEKNWLGVYLPISYQSIAGITPGLAFMVGPILLGTGNFPGFIWESEQRTADLFVSLNLSRLKKLPEDKDGDQVSDPLDECPGAAGTFAHQGCPDTDGDGKYDNEDMCPTTFGTKSNGCPEIKLQELTKLDADRDGIPDSLDQCPLTKGPSINQGCPIVDSADVQIINKAIRNIEFTTGDTVLLAHSITYLQSVAKVIKKYEGIQLHISGHTDNNGEKADNLLLSRRRALAVQHFLEKEGIPSKQMKIFYYGENQPLVPNTTPENQRRNRRVELKIIFQ